MDFHPGGIDELMRGVGKDATKLFESVSRTTSDPPVGSTAPIGRWSTIWFLRTHRSFVAGARLGQLSKHPAKMRGREAEPWIGERQHPVADGEHRVEHGWLFVGDVEPDNKLHEWVISVAHVDSLAFCLADRRQKMNERIKGKTFVAFKMALCAVCDLNVRGVLNVSWYICFEWRYTVLTEIYQ